MKKENFEKLLRDLYSIYYTEKLENDADIKNLIRQYGGGMENIAIQIMLVKYNVDGNKGYNPSVNRDNVDKFASELIEFYSSGGQINREEWSINNNVEPNPIIQQVANVEAKFEEVHSKIREEILKAKEEFSFFIKEKMVELNSKVAQIESGIQKNTDSGILSHMSIKLTLMNFKASEIKELPSDEVFACAGINDRFVLIDKNGLPFGIIVQDVIYDFITSDKLIKELTLNRI